MLERQVARMAGAVIAGAACLCFSGCGAEEAAQGLDEPGPPQIDPRRSVAQAAWQPAMREGLRETPVGAPAAHQKQLRLQGSGRSNGGNGQGSNCVRAVTPAAEAFRSTTNQLSIPFTALPVCREVQASGAFLEAGGGSERIAEAHMRSSSADLGGEESGTGVEGDALLDTDL
jgi:hypothetical protein